MVVRICVATLLLAGCGGPPAETVEGPLLPEDRLALPQYSLEQYRALIDELEGTPVVVNFWGSWCPPCEDEAPALAAVSRDLQGEVQFLGVDILDNRPEARAFIERFDWVYPSIFDPQAAIRDGLGYLGQPITLIYDASGELVFEHTGTLTEELLREELRPVTPVP